jgi:hypothetical protein
MDNNSFLPTEEEVTEEEEEEGSSRQSSAFFLSQDRLVRSIDSVTKNRSGTDEAEISLTKSFRRKARLQQITEVRSTSLFQGQQLSTLQTLLKSEMVEIDLGECSSLYN